MAIAAQLMFAKADLGDDRQNDSGHILLVDIS